MTDCFKHNLPRALAALLAVCLLLCACSPAGAPPGSGASAPSGRTSMEDRLRTLLGRGRPQDIDFDALVYERPDTGAIGAQIDEALRLLESDDPDALFALYEEIYTAFDHLDTMSTLASLRSDLDLSDEYYEEESLFLSDEYTRLNNRFLELTCAILDSPCAEEARDFWGDEYIEQVRRHRALNDPAVEPLSAEEQRLINEYHRVSAEAVSADLGDGEVTLDALDLSSPEGVAAYYEIYRGRNERLGAIYRELVDLRMRIAQTLGFDSYTEYAYALLERDYTGEEAAELCARVKTLFVPLMEALETQCAERLEAAGQAALSPEDALPLLETALEEGRYPARMSEALQYMRTHGFYDFGGGENRVQMAYTTYLRDWRAPFLFVNTDAHPGADTLFHEFGHFYNFYISGDGGSIDLAETHSQGLELLMLDAYDDVYGAYGDAMECETVWEILSALLEGCMEEEFQQAVFAQPDMTAEELNALHARLSAEYIGFPLPFEWVDIPHNFEVPFYYISYATSAISALSLWASAEEDRAAGIAIYDALTRADASAGYRETLADAGLDDPFAPETLEHIAAALNDRFSLGLYDGAAAA